MTVPWWWLIVVAMAAGSLGLIIAAMLAISKQADDWNEVYDSIEANNKYHRERRDSDV
ncbi:hypothetical protein SCACP_21680 [Sporomusa carbonis]|uniref:hypothetical protein n=1 Tax=Sporomusa carbonis TaxID=3076075 RepID=UPI003A78DB2F